ncbi:YheU family protein [Neptuniibacter caesariensis]|uniref:YheU family protein n=1 Tax=Neptuniibacter caesariensis TaxID=207954 RepID=A0A7U8GRS2_NEPCE|nr:YheU family protein [Neptuniibacter caesariensis]EAR60538.1 hypothetical protein MED92_16780 [Oceanospirillum sp. MED92] [Neptuniibacter caesariensis]
MIIPFEQLNPETLNALIEEFVSRDGTDYGEFEASLVEKVSQVSRMLRSGEVVILFSESTGQCNIVPKELL